jgi:hypothetical protein
LSFVGAFCEEIFVIKTGHWGAQNQSFQKEEQVFSFLECAI